MVARPSRRVLLAVLMLLPLAAVVGGGGPAHATSVPLWEPEAYDG